MGGGLWEVCRIKPWNYVHVCTYYTCKICIWKYVKVSDVGDMPKAYMVSWQNGSLGFPSPGQLFQCTGLDGCNNFGNYSDFFYSLTMSNQQFSRVSIPGALSTPKRSLRKLYQHMCWVLGNPRVRAQIKQRAYDVLVELLKASRGAPRLLRTHFENTVLI